MALSSDDLNCLIYQYLIESGAPPPWPLMPLAMQSTHMCRAAQVGCFADSSASVSRALHIHALALTTSAAPQATRTQDSLSVRKGTYSLCALCWHL